MKIILIITSISMLFAEQKYKEPQYDLLSKDNNIEIRQYDKYVVAKTTVLKADSNEDNNMFRTLASYIFGGNSKNQSIPMTAPVTTFDDKEKHNMIFYMLDVNNAEDLPLPNNTNITLDTFSLNKCAVIKFSWFTSESRIKRYKNELKKYLEDNSLVAISSYMVNRYDPPWRLPFMRRNEIIVQIQ